jgi:hypothetical protein
VARQPFCGWEDGGAEARGGASCAGLGSSSASTRSRSSARRIRRFAAQAAQEWLRRRLPCSAVTAPRPPLPELQAPSLYPCPAALIDGRASGLRRIGGGREAPRNPALPAGASSRAPPASRGRPRSELRRRKEAPAPRLPAGWREEGDGGGSGSGGGSRSAEGATVALQKAGKAPGMRSQGGLRSFCSCRCGSCRSRHNTLSFFILC